MEAAGNKTPASTNRPISAPHTRPTLRPYASGGAHARSPNGGSLLAGGGGKPPIAADAARAKKNSGVRFQQLYALHVTLLRNLEGHRAASGADVAKSVLQASVAEAQVRFGGGG